MSVRCNRFLLLILESDYISGSFLWKGARMKRTIEKFILKNDYVNEDMQIRVEIEDGWYLVTIKGLNSGYKCDCYFKDFVELLKYTLNISLRSMALEDEIKVLKERLNG